MLQSLTIYFEYAIMRSVSSILGIEFYVFFNEIEKSYLQSFLLGCINLFNVADFIQIGNGFYNN